MILVRDPDAPDRPREAVGRRLFGNPDEAFLQSKPKQGLLTPAEVRCDRARADGHRPIEHRVGHRRRQRLGEHRGGPNGAPTAPSTPSKWMPKTTASSARTPTASAFRTSTPSSACARKSCDDLPDPDAVFVAGAGREVTRISEAAYGRLRRGGRLVVNTTSIDHLDGAARNAARPFLRRLHVWMINLARGTDQLDRLSFDPVKPSFLLAVTKA